MQPLRNRARPPRELAGFVLLLALAGAAPGCATDQTPTRVMVTPISTAMLPAKPPNCDMPVLTREPAAAYQQIAIVEAWANVNEDPANVLPELKRQACATGAQALLIVGDRKQDIKTLLYGVTPNEKEKKITSENRDPNQAADYIRTMQHHPRIGERGHTGFYIDALAIDYTPGASAADEPSTP